jgi:hypothetical protein
MRFGVCYPFHKIDDIVYIEYRATKVILFFAFYKKITNYGVEAIPPHQYLV